MRYIGMVFLPALLVASAPVLEPIRMTMQPNKKPIESLVPVYPADQTVVLPLNVVLKPVVGNPQAVDRLQAGFR